MLSIPNYVIKKGPSHGARHGNTERQRKKLRNSQRSKEGKEKCSQNLLDRFLNSPRYRAWQTAIGWDEDVCARYDAIAAEDHSYIATQAERRRNENYWKLVLNTSGKNVLVDQRDDYQEAGRTCERLYEEQRKGNTRLHPKDQVRQRRNQQLLGPKSSERVDPKTGWRWYDHPSTSSSSSIWQAASWWKSSSWNER